MHMSFATHAFTIGLAGLLGFGSRSTPPPDQDVRFVSASDQTTLVYPFLDAVLKLDGDIGTVAFRLSELISISGTATGLEIETVTQDRHRGTPKRTRFPYRQADSTTDFEIAGERVSLQATHGTRPPESLPPHVELQFNDGRQVRVQRDGLRIPVTFDDATVEVPGSDLRALRIITETRGHPPTVIVSRLSGRVERGILEASHSVRATDLFSNRLVVPLHDIRTILADRNTLEAVPVSGTRRNDGRTIIRLRDGRTLSGDVLTRTWQLQSAIGTLTFSKEMLQHMEAESRGRMMMCTVLGERISGRISPGVVEINTQQGVETVSLNEVSHIFFPGSTTPVPANWMTAVFAKGERLIVRFPGLEPPFERPPELPPIQSIVPAGRRGLTLTTATGATVQTRVDGARVELVVMSAMDHLSVRWSDLQSLSTGTYGIPPHPETQRSAAPASSIVPPPAPHRALATSERIPLRFDSVLGQLELPATAIAAIHVADRGRTCFIETVSGDGLAVSRIRRSELLAFVEAQSLGPLPDTGTLALRASRTDRTAAAPQIPVWRLNDGSVIAARMESPQLSFRPHGGSRGQTVEIATAGIETLVRIDRNRVMMTTRQGELNGRILSDRIVLTPTVTGTEFAIRISEIEAMSQAGFSRLPPALNEHIARPPHFGNQVLIKGGAFIQGNAAPDALPEETPPYPAVVDDFWMDRTPVTVAQFARFCEATGYTSIPEKQRRAITWREPGFQQTALDPVVAVSWIDAAAFCNWRSLQAGLTPVYTLTALPDVELDLWADGFRLPSEAEWEFAARERGQDLLYPWGNTVPPDRAPANFNQAAGSPQDGWLYTNPVMAFPPNRLGLFDMAGNTWEWCQDWFHVNAYHVLRQRQPRNPLMTTPAQPSPRRSMRGGAFNLGRDFMRTTSRGHGHPFASSHHVGFRCVRSVTPADRQP